MNHFVNTAATELKNGIRINAVSPTVEIESHPIYQDYFPGFESAPTQVANAYFKSVMDVQTVQIFEVFSTLIFLNIKR